MIKFNLILFHTTKITQTKFRVQVQKKKGGDEKVNGIRLNLNLHEPPSLFLKDENKNPELNKQSMIIKRY